jgi:hypothetical protein
MEPKHVGAMYNTVCVNYREVGLLVLMYLQKKTIRFCDCLRLIQHRLFLNIDYS